MAEPADGGPARQMTRRGFLTRAGAGTLAVFAIACDGTDTDRPGALGGTAGPSVEPVPERRDLRLSARPAASVAGPIRSGESSLGLARERDAILYVPPGLRPDRPAALVVCLHGASGDALGGLGLFRRHADDAGLVLLAPASRQGSWDFRIGSGPDAPFVDRALAAVLERVPVDPTRLAVAGFSAGASFALSLGLANGDLFSHVIALSPGYLLRHVYRGSPRVFIAHGTRDTTLSIGSSSRRIVPELRGEGFDVTYVEFDGAHEAPPRITSRAVGWLLGQDTETPTSRR